MHLLTFALSYKLATVTLVGLVGPREANAKEGENPVRLTLFCAQTYKQDE